jgi:hypothetical protein
VTDTLSQRISRLFPGLDFIKKHLFYIVTILLTIIFLAQGLAATRTEKINLKEIGLWLKQSGYQKSVIMAPDRFARLVFYADGKMLEMPDSWKDLIDAIQRNGVRIVVIDPCTIKEDCPDFLASLPGSRLYPIPGPKGREEKRAIQMYGVR